MRRIIIIVLFTFIITATAIAQENSRRIEMKSAIITMSSELMEQTLITKKYLDNYGLKFAQFTVIPYFEDGERKETLMMGRIRNEGTDTTVDYINKVLTAQKDESDVINFLNLTEETIRKYKIKKLGEEDVCGKPCVIYSMSYKSQGVNTKDQVWVWKGITLKRRVTSFAQDREVVAVDIQEDVPIDSSVFVVPDYPLKSWPDKAKN